VLIAGRAHVNTLAGKIRGFRAGDRARGPDEIGVAAQERSHASRFATAHDRESADAGAIASGKGKDEIPVIAANCLFQRQAVGGCIGCDKFGNELGANGAAADEGRAGDLGYYATLNFSRAAGANAVEAGGVHFDQTEIGRFDDEILAVEGLEIAVDLEGAALHAQYYVGGTEGTKLKNSDAKGRKNQF